MQILINIGLILTYLMVGFAALAAIGFGIKKMLANTNNAKKTLYTIAGLAFVLLLSYLIASNEVLHSFEKYKKRFGDWVESKNDSTGFYVRLKTFDEYKTKLDDLNSFLIMGLK